MWPFRKKEETVESLIKDCNKLYSSFNYSLTLAHYQNYYEFKKSMKKNFFSMHRLLATHDNESVTISLLKTFKEQLTFFQKHPFSCYPEAFYEFTSKHLPYEDKLNLVIKNVNDNNNDSKLKM